VDQAPTDQGALKVCRAREENSSGFVSPSAKPPAKKAKASTKKVKPPATKATSKSKLSTYRAKRDPQKTPEPMGATKGRPVKGDAMTFVIQEHHATALHWDFRLEREGVLVSWALPKGLPTDPKANHLAVHTEDHPLDYASFEGDIPEGEYGGGQVTVWDHGTYDLEKWRDNEVKIVLHGKKASGRYVLFPTGGKNWMIHRMDPPAKDFEKMPSLVKPMLAEAGSLPTSDEGWAYEFKWDGVRAVVYVSGGRVRALTRNQKDLVSTFPELRDVGLFLGSRSAILDGEIVALDGQGRPDFGALSHRLHLTSKSAVTKMAASTPASFLAFDVVFLDDHSLVARTYDERRERLESLKLQGDTFATPPSITNAKGSDILAIAKERGLEGVVLKKRDSPYAPGKRNGQWVKVKNFRTQEVVIGGWTDGKGDREGSLGALLLGVPGEGGLIYVGKVGTGFSGVDRDEMLTTLKPLASKKSPFNKKLSPVETSLAHFVKPTLVGEVQFAEWTKDGHLRQPAWRGFRPDKDPKEVIREP
jgi:bifunctional non-homologous end joining protein LigD